METLEEYFSRLDTPAAGSPVGQAIVQMARMYPAVPFEELRRRLNAVKVASFSSPAVAIKSAAAMDPSLGEAAPGSVNRLSPDRIARMQAGRMARRNENEEIAASLRGKEA